MKKNKKIDLDIKTKYNVKTKIEIPDKNLFMIPSYICYYAPGFSGKTLLMVNLCHKLKKYFKDGNIFAFTNSYCPTIHKMIEDRKGHLYYDFYDRYGNNVIEELLQFQKKQKEEDPDNLENILLIFDDVISSKEFENRRSIFTKLFSMGRHFQITIFLSSQVYNMIPKSIRKMAYYNIIFKFPESELPEILEENCSFLSKKDFERVYREATKDKYDFLFLQIKEQRMLEKF